MVELDLISLGFFGILDDGKNGNFSHSLYVTLVPQLKYYVIEIVSTKLLLNQNMKSN